MRVDLRLLRLPSRQLTLCGEKRRLAKGLEIDYFLFLLTEGGGRVPSTPCLDSSQIHGASRDGEGGVLGLCICAYVTNL